MSIPRRLRPGFGLLPHANVIFEEADRCVVVRPAVSKRALIKEWLRHARGVAGGGATDDVMRMTRAECVVLVDTNILLDRSLNALTVERW